jgi:hypothetical protein
MASKQIIGGSNGPKAGPSLASFGMDLVGSTGISGSGGFGRQGI